MQTDIIRVNSKGAGREEALKTTEKFAVYQELDRKESLKLRLLCEEALGLVGAIAGDFEAEYWLEGKADHVSEIHLSLTTHMNAEKRQEMIDASAAKKNAAAVGFMGKVRAFVERVFYAAGEFGSEENTDGIQVFFYNDMDITSGAELGPVGYVWTLESYKNAIEPMKAADKKAEEAWDELEKSIVANVADDVRIGVRGNKAEIVITRKSA